jgi:hypothetical protein
MYIKNFNEFIGLWAVKQEFSHLMEYNIYTLRAAQYL